MKLHFILIFLLFSLTKSYGQNILFKILSDKKETLAVIDSIGYIKKHKNLSTINIEQKNIIEKLNKIGYLSAFFEPDFKNDTIVTAKINIGNLVPTTYLYISKKTRQNNSTVLKEYPDTLKIKTQNLSWFLESVLNKTENTGFALAEVKLNNIIITKNSLFAELLIEKNIVRKIDQIVINGYDKFANNYKKAMHYTYKGKNASTENLKKIEQSFANIGFIQQTKPPEILFTKDSTKVYLFIAKKNCNNFEGFLGFTNDDQQKTKLSGFLDLQTQNLLLKGESFHLVWKSNPNQQKTLDAKIEIPFIFGLPTIAKARLNIVKQDSLYQNTETSAALGFFIKYNLKSFIEYQTAESTAITQNNPLINGYNNTFYKLQIEYLKKEDYFALYPQKAFYNSTVGFGKRIANGITTLQYFLQLEAGMHFKINPTNSFFLQTKNKYLKSNNYLTNELYLLGGTNTIRGYADNSLQANFYSIQTAEYRYHVAQTMCLFTFIDYAFVHNNPLGQKNTFSGLGLGTLVQTGKGNIQISFARGDSNSMGKNYTFHVAYKTSF